MTTVADSSRTKITANERDYTIHSLPNVAGEKLSQLPYSLRILLENLLRHRDGVSVTDQDIQAIVDWNPTAEPTQEIAFTPARVILQDFTGVPAIVDLAAMRDAMVDLGGDPDLINPLAPVELVIDHSVQVDKYGSDDAIDFNNKIEFERNKERYGFLHWGQQAFHNFKVVPPNTGIVHQVNLEHLGRVVFDMQTGSGRTAYPDTLVGTDSHTTMINALGILGWGVGGIEAEAAMLGQPVTMLIPQVVGVEITGQLPVGTTATDLVLTVTETLRETGVVGKFVEFCGDGLDHLTLADRATLANMSPEFGSTCAIFPIDAETINYLKLSGRDLERTELVETYAKAQGLWRNPGDAIAKYSQLVKVDLSQIEPSIAGPKRPQDRIGLSQAKSTIAKLLQAANPTPKTANAKINNSEVEMMDGAVLIAAITSCTNTSNPTVMVGAGLLARNAHEKGLTVKPWVKTSLAPGSKVVTRYLEDANLMDDLSHLGFNLVGYGCTTCIGNSGPLLPEIETAVADSDLVGCSVLSGNRNFEGRIHPLSRMNFLASPPLVVAYALAGQVDFDFATEALGTDSNGDAVFLKDIWPSDQEIRQLVSSCVSAQLFKNSYEDVFKGDSNWDSLASKPSKQFQWQPDSTYVRNPPYFHGMSRDTGMPNDIENARVLVKVGDSVTTDHISPAGTIAPDSPAASYLAENGVERRSFNSYGSRRGNHEVMMRGTFANIRLRNQLAPGTEGGWTNYLPANEVVSIFDASQRYQETGTPLIVIAGSEYGTGSSRDWAAKGPQLLGVKAVIAKSYERIHRSNLIGMGILPLEFNAGDDANSLGLDGHETYTIRGISALKAGSTVVVETINEQQEAKSFAVTSRIDTPKELDYYRNGGILQYVLRQLVDSDRKAA